MKAKRQSTVEPVFATLIQFTELRKINTIGIHQANKGIYMAAIAYNLKQYLKYISKNVKTETKGIVLSMVYLKSLLQTSNKAHTTHLITILKPYFKKQKTLRKELLSDYTLSFSGLCNGYHCWQLGLFE